MPVMPEKGVSIAKTYPTRVNQRTLDVITLPGKVYEPIDFIRGVWSGLTTVGGATSGHKRKEHKPLRRPDRKRKPKRGKFS